jgi:aspartate dehydrogenase
MRNMTEQRDPDLPGDQPPERIGLIGFGAIGRSVLEHLPAGVVVAGVLVRPTRVAETSRLLPRGLAVVDTPEALLRLEVTAVAECAGQEALKLFGEEVLEHGVDLLAVSTGALADDEFRCRLVAAGGRGGSRLIVPAGAIGGLDALGALRLGGLTRVFYRSFKPPHAWRDTPAENVVDLMSLRRAVTIFEGSAREAATLFPKNANVAVTVALAAGALDETVVELIADPTIDENIGVVEVEGKYGSLRIDLRGPASPDNPRTSAITALSLVRAIQQRAGVLMI